MHGAFLISKEYTVSELHVFDELSKSMQLAVATKVANFCTNTNEINGIIPLSIDEIMETQWAIVSTVNEKFAGYVRLKQEIVHEKTLRTYQSIGTLVVAGAFQGNGIGAELVSKITDDIFTTTNIPFAHCNSLSLKSFQTAGYIAAMPGVLPAAATSAYNNRSLIFPRRDI